MAESKKNKEFLSSDTDTKRVLAPMGYWGDEYNYTLFAMDKPMTYLLSFGLIGGLIGSVLPYKQYVINFSEKGITTIPLNLFSSKVEENKVSHVPSQSVIGIMAKRGPLRATFKITLDGRKWVIVAYKKVISLPNQLSNLEKAIEISNK